MDGQLAIDGSFFIREVPPGSCRVCVIFYRGDDAWTASASDTGSGAPVDLELRPMDEASRKAWVKARPPP